MIAVAIVWAVSFAAEGELAPASSSVAAISGQEGLTAGLDEKGGLSVLRWPGPGGPDQMRQPDDSPPASISGGRWGVETGGHWHWVGDAEARTRQNYVAPGSPIIETTTEWPSTGLTVRQRAGVLPGREVFVSAIEIIGGGARPRAAWVADFAPATRLVPELAIGDSSLDALNGFAAFVDRNAGRIWSFRPRKPGKTEWTRARELASHGTKSDAWKGFTDGVWIGLRADTPATTLVVASSLRESVAAVESRETALSAAVGQTAVGIEPALTSTGAGYRAWIAIGVGGNRAVAENALNSVDAASGFFEHPPGAPAPPSAIASLPAEFVANATRHWATLRTLHDGASGFTLRGAAAEPQLARDWPRDGVLAAWALFEAGDRDMALKSVEAYLAKVLTIERPRRPSGSMPESMYADGGLASPHFVVDDRGPARVLWVADRIVHSLDEKNRAAWVSRHWAAIEATGEFLSIWMDARRGAPLWATDPIGFSDGMTQDRVFAAHGGIAAAMRLAGYGEKTTPEAWRVRWDQLEALAEWVLTHPGKWRCEDALMLEAEGIPADALERAFGVCAKRLESPIGLDATQTARLLLQKAILDRQARSTDRETVNAGFRNGLRRVDGDDNATAGEVDSRVSAATLLALLLEFKP